jgi:hypothetical protein
LCWWSHHHKITKMGVRVSEIEVRLNVNAEC